MLNLDTHILVHALGDELRPSERRLLSAHEWSISAIVLWEMSKLVQLGRIRLDLDAREVEQTLSSIRVWPLDLAVCRASTGLDVRSDPADELIGATSVVHGIPLLTRDRKLLRSKVIPLARARA
jgi:PIN domain nuclease of toxin-antitoxin system